MHGWRECLARRPCFESFSSRERRDRGKSASDAKDKILILPRIRVPPPSHAAGKLLSLSSHFRARHSPISKGLLFTVTIHLRSLSCSKPVILKDLNNEVAAVLRKGPYHYCF